MCVGVLRILTMEQNIIIIALRRYWKFEIQTLKKRTIHHLHTHFYKPPTFNHLIPKSISRRLSNNSSNIDIFNKNKHILNAIKNSGYEQTLEYTPPKCKSKHRNWNITLFNPRYNQCVTSNIGRDFLNLKSKDFPSQSPLDKIFNWNNIKVSYSYTSNVSQIIKGHNKKIETIHSNTQPKKQCNCRDKKTCPLLGNCLHKNVV